MFYVEELLFQLIIKYKKFENFSKIIEILKFKKESGNYNLSVTCPHCGKKWYIVWEMPYRSGPSRHFS
jgi:rRNA maturation protein Nop10